MTSSRGYAICVARCKLAQERQRTQRRQDHGQAGWRRNPHGRPGRHRSRRSTTRRRCRAGRGTWREQLYVGEVAVWVESPGPQSQTARPQDHDGRQVVGPIHQKPDCTAARCTTAHQHRLGRIRPISLGTWPEATFQRFRVISRHWYKPCSESEHAVPDPLQALCFLPSPHPCVMRSLSAPAVSQARVAAMCRVVRPRPAHTASPKRPWPRVPGVEWRRVPRVV